MSPVKPLPPSTVSSKRDLLINILFELSKGYLDNDEHEMDYYASKFSEVYSDGYRQLYSELFPVLSSISNDDADRLQPLSSNLFHLHRYVGQSEHWSKSNPELFGHLLKLSDHVNLEVQRMVEHQNNEDRFNDLYSESSDLYSKFSDLYNKSLKIEQKNKKYTKKIKNLQLEMISILAIFAAIVIAFSAGINILGNAISNVGYADLSNLSFVIILCGIILFNTVAFLMHVIFWIIHRLNNPIKEDSKLVDWKYIVYFNFLLIFLLGLCLLV